MRLLQITSTKLELGAWSLSGRYYAMDRDRRAEVKRAYDVMTQDGPGDGRSVVRFCRDSCRKVHSSSSSQSGLPRAVEPGDGVF